MKYSTIPKEIEDVEAPGASLSVVSAAQKSHVCHFYSDRQDLLDILIPFFKEGLEAGEFCLWGADEPLTKEDAMGELKKAVPNLEDYIDKGQLEIFAAGELYQGRLDSQRTYDRFMKILHDALDKGFAGFRCNGNTRGVPSRDWLSLMIYESYIDAGVRRFPVTTMCSYAQEKCGVEEIAGLEKVHQSTLIKRDGAWVLIPSPTAF